MKKIIAFLAIIVVAAVGLIYFWPAKTGNINQTLIEVSTLYADNLLKTSELPKLSEKDYASGMEDLKKLADNWELLYKKTNELAEIADKSEVSYQIISETYAYDKNQITDIFDKAPPGKKIKTLAKELNVSAEKAYKLLKMSQQELTADAWNNAGDTFETLENTARVIQDGCKVGLMVGGAHLAGGAGAAVGLLQKAGVIIGGADLVLQIGQDTSNIAFGYNNQAAAIFGDIRKITEPGATLIGFAGLYDIGDKAIDLFNASTFVIEQSNAMIQEGKVIGVKIRKDKSAEISSLAEPEVGDWLKDNEILDKADKESIMKEIADLTKKMTDETKDEIQPKTEKKDTEPAKEEPVEKKNDKPSAAADNSSNGLSADNFIGEWHVQNMATKLQSNDPYIVKPGGKMEYRIQAGTESIVYNYTWKIENGTVLLSSPDFGDSYYKILDKDTLEWTKSIMTTGKIMEPGKDGLVGSRVIRKK